MMSCEAFSTISVIYFDSPVSGFASQMNQVCLSFGVPSTTTSSLSAFASCHLHALWLEVARRLSWLTAKTQRQKQIHPKQTSSRGEGLQEITSLCTSTSTKSDVPAVCSTVLKNIVFSEKWRHINSSVNLNFCGIDTLTVGFCLPLMHRAQTLKVVMCESNRPVSHSCSWAVSSTVSVYVYFSLLCMEC